MENHTYTDWSRIKYLLYVEIHDVVMDLEQCKSQERMGSESLKVNATFSSSFLFSQFWRTGFRLEVFPHQPMASVVAHVAILELSLTIFLLKNLSVESSSGLEWMYRNRKSYTCTLKLTKSPNAYRKLLPFYSNSAHDTGWSYSQCGSQQT